MASDEADQQSDDDAPEEADVLPDQAPHGGSEGASQRKKKPVAKATKPSKTQLSKPAQLNVLNYRFKKPLTQVRIHPNVSRRPESRLLNCLSLSDMT